jgi:hypothetical protein
MTTTDSDHELVRRFVAGAAVAVDVVYTFGALAFAIAVALFATPTAATAFAAAAAGILPATIVAVELAIAIAFDAALVAGALVFAFLSADRLGRRLFVLATLNPERRLDVPVFPSIVRRLAAVAIVVAIPAVIVSATPFARAGELAIAIAAGVASLLTAALAVRDATPRRQAELLEQLVAMNNRRAIPIAVARRRRDR